MAIKTDHFYIGDRLFNRVYSDAGRYVVRDGVEYSEACDPAEFGRTYTEGNIIEYDTGESEEAKALTRFSNELTGQNDPDLLSAAETMITKLYKEE